MSQSPVFRLLLALLFPGAPLLAGAPEGGQRIVTVGGAATEIVFALGRGDAVVGVDLSSTYPPEVRDLPQVGYVRSIGPEGILSLNPSLIVATEALGPPAAKKVMKQVRVPTVWLPEPDSLHALEQSVTAVADRLNVPERGRALLDSVRARLAEAEAAANGWNTVPRVLFFLNPPSAGMGGMVGGLGSRADSLIRLAGARNAADSFPGFKQVSIEGILEMNPDVILVALSPGHGGSPESVEALRERAELAPVNAIREGAVFGVPLDDIAFGPRLGEAALRWNTLIGEGIR